MHLKQRAVALSLFTVLRTIIIHCDTAHAQAFTDAGFENYVVNSGEFLKPTVGPWTFTNDAGVVEPFAPNSSTGALNTWSATFSPVEGQQYASTYAGGDSIRQGVTFASAGQFAISVYAASPSGTVTIPGVGTSNLTSGAFTFTLAGVGFGNLHNLLPGTGWTLFSEDFSIDKSGIYQLGIDNTVTAPYFINYDAFAIVAVPEPPSLVLAAFGTLSAAVFSRFGCTSQLRLQ